MDKIKLAVFDLSGTTIKELFQVFKFYLMPHLTLIFNDPYKGSLYSYLEVYYVRYFKSGFVFSYQELSFNKKIFYKK